MHAWARRLLSARGEAPVLDGQDAAFRAAWSAVGEPGLLGRSLLPVSYWRDEVGAVIKGRGLSDVDQYLALERIGRRNPLREEQRRAVWQLFEQYQQRLSETGVADFDDLLLLALDSIRNRPLSTPYTSVIVDEVQDLSCTGLRLLHALVGDRPDGLLLVGDGQQSVYPGGFTLSEAGVNVQGRATVLSTNYRNAAEVLARALDVVSADRFDDLDAEPELGARAVDVERSGGQVAYVACRDAASQSAALVHTVAWTIDHGTRAGDMAVLVPSNREVRAWRTVLEAAGLPVSLLNDYDGRPTDAVKVGTYQRAKGLEFTCVLLPDHDTAVPPQQPDETEEAYRERAELQRRQLFVAMTRARDRLWLGSRG